jgi:hypothetical protein
MTSEIEQQLADHVRNECDDIVRDMARHVGDEVHAVLRRHGMLMKSVGAAAGMGVLAAANVLAETLLFFRNSMTEGDETDAGADVDFVAAAEVALLAIFAAALPADMRAALAAALKRGDDE